MIYYQKGYFGSLFCCRVIGTAWPHGVLPGCIATGISIGMSYWPWLNEITLDKDQYIGHPYGLRMFCAVLGLVMVFKTNFAYQRYWESAGALQCMAAKWLDGALMAITFDAGGSNTDPLLHGSDHPMSEEDHPKSGSKGGVNHSDYVSDICHFASLLHALALQHLRADNDLDNLERAYTSAEGFTVCKLMSERGMPSKVFRAGDVSSVFRRQKLAVLGGVSPQERKALETDNTGQVLDTDARVAMAESWLMRRMLSRQKFEQGESAVTSPPILSRLYQVISDGTLWFGVASKAAIVPFPFPYQSILTFFLWVYTLIAPALINGIIFENSFRAVFTFMAVAVYHSLKAIGDNLEDPYLPYDPNELPLPALQQIVNNRLYSYGVVYSVPQPDPESPDSRAPPADSAVAEADCGRKIAAADQCCASTTSKQKDASPAPVEELQSSEPKRILAQL